MQVNDYVKWGGQCVKILSESHNYYWIKVLETGRTKKTNSCYSISLLKRGVLEACGFVQNANNPKQYDCQIPLVNTPVTITYHIMPLKRECQISYIDVNNNRQTYFSDQIISCDGLQNIVRQLVKIEMPIDVASLIKAVKKNQWLFVL